MVLMSHRTVNGSKRGEDQERGSGLSILKVIFPKRGKDPDKPEEMKRGSIKGLRRKYAERRGLALKRLLPQAKTVAAFYSCIQAIAELSEEENGSFFGG